MFYPELCKVCSKKFDEAIEKAKPYALLCKQDSGDSEMGVYITAEVAARTVDAECRNMIRAEDNRRLQSLLLYAEENRDSLLAKMMAEPVNLKLAADFLGFAIGFAVPTQKETQ